MAQSAEVIIRLRGDATGATAAIQKTKSEMAGLEDQGKKSKNVLKEFGAAINYSIIGPLSNLFTGLRQISQGLQSVAFLASSFISLPLAAVFKKASDVARDYDEALINIQKTTNLTDEALGRLNAGANTLNGRMRELAKTVATPLDELAELAGTAGQMGVRGVDNLMNFVRVSEIIGKTTDIAAGDALKAFGRLARGMGVESEKAGDFIIKLANTVNMLENTTAGSASEIVAAVENMIAAASGMATSAAPALVAFGATLYDLGVNARSAGTMFERMTQYVAANISEIAALMGREASEVRKAFDEDFTGAMLDFLEALSQVESETRRTEIAQDLFGKRAGRAVSLLANNLDALVDNIEAANKEFHSGDSLITEYNNAMKSANAQMGILQNNLRVAAVILADTFLPIINTVVAWAVPIVQELAEAFAELPQNIKLGIGAAAALAAVFGPLLVIISTLGFSLSMILSGLANVAVGVIGLGTKLLALTPIIAAVATALIGLGQFAERGVSRIGDVFLNAADAAEGWGLGIVSSLAAGMIRGIATVVNAAVKVANAIARFFRAFSPPKYGPLKDMTVWGKELIQAYVEGFTKADFSAVEDVTSKIASHFQALAGAGLMDEKDVVPAILEVRHAFTELLDIFDETGEISEDVLGGIRDRMGEAGDRVAEYLKLYLQVNEAQKEYNRSSRRLEEISRLRDKINASYDKEITAIQSSGKPYLEQMRMISRAGRERDDQLGVLSEEERLQRNVRDEAKQKLDQHEKLLDRQEGLINYYQEELDLYEDHVSALEAAGGAAAGAASKAAGAAGELEGALEGVAGVELDDIFDGAGSGLEEMLAKVKTIPEEMRKASEAVGAFFAGLKGEEIGEPTPATQPGQIDPDTISGPMARAYEVGGNIRGIFDKLITKVRELADEFDNLADSIDKATDTEGGLDWFNENRGIVGIITAIGTAFVSFKILNALVAAGTFVKTAAGISGIGAAIAPLFGWVGLLAATIGLFAGMWVADFADIQETTGNVVGHLERLFENLGDAAEATGGKLGRIWAALKKDLNEKWEDLRDTVFIPFRDMLRGLGEDAVKLKNGIVEGFGIIQTKITEAWESVKEDALIPFRDMLKGLRGDAVKLKDGIVEGFGLIGDEVNKEWERLDEQALTPMSNMFKGLKEDGELLVNGIIEGFELLWEEGRKPLQDFKEFVDDKVGSVVNTFGDVRDAIDDVIERIPKIDFSGINIPGLITPGSPSPLEEGLRGIGSALDDLDQVSVTIDITGAELVGAVSDWIGELEGFQKWLGKNFTQVEKTIVKAFTDAGRSSTRIWDRTERSIVRSFTNATRVVARSWSTLTQSIRREWNTLEYTAINGFVDGLASIAASATRMTSTVVSAFTSIPSDVGGALAGFKDFAVNDVFNPIEGAINSVARALDNLQSKIDRFNADSGDLDWPDEYTPTSPPPLEIGLRGIKDALDDLDRARLTIFSNTPEFAYADAGGGVTHIETVQLGEKVVVPNMQIGRSMVNDLMEKMSASVRARRTGA